MLEGSAIWKRRMPLRTTQRKASRIISSSHGCQAMKRMPVVMKLRSVVGIAWLTSRIRSQGSSLWKRTDTAICVLEVKSSAWKPTRSIVGAIDSTSGVVRPVALHRLWLPSRVVVSTISTSRPVTAAAAAIAGLSRCVRAPGPCLPTKLRLEVDAQRCPDGTWSPLVPRHIEQPACRH